MKITKSQLKKIIREEYSRLKRQGLINEIAGGYSRAANYTEEDHRYLVDDIKNELIYRNRQGKLKAAIRNWRWHMQDSPFTDPDELWVDERGYDVAGPEYSISEGDEYIMDNLLWDILKNESDQQYDPNDDQYMMVINSIEKFSNDALLLYRNEILTDSEV